MKLAKLIFNRLFIVGFAIVAQLALFLVIFLRLNEYFTAFSVVMNVLSIAVVVSIINRDMITEAKISWIIITLLLPVFGSVLYLTLSYYHLSREEREKQGNMYPIFAKCMESELKNHHKSAQASNEYFGQFQYINTATGLPAYSDTNVDFYPMGQDFWRALLRELKNAKKYIFMEYFIIEDGIMYQSIFEILKEKAAEGVDVRLMYDDLGCVKTLPWNFDKTLKSHGIKCVKFNPFKPVISERHNNRNHKKITVIDDHTAFVGGINIADEYINYKKRFGTWKDSGVMLRGRGVKSLTAMFLKGYYMQSETKEEFSCFFDADYENENTSSVVMPYSDEPNPEDLSYVAENVYLNIINQAKKYLYITTPYLIIDEKLESALIRASYRGVDVRIVTPHIPDKKLIFAMTRASYKKLVPHGIKIYEYTPGFIHSKQILCDDVISSVGTVNLDYRSFLHHYECGVLMYNTPCNEDIKKDFENIFSLSCNMCDYKQNKLVSMFCRFMMAFTPLL